MYIAGFCTAIRVLRTNIYILYRYTNNRFFFFLQVHILSPFIMNGVCVQWRGRINLEKLDGIGCLEFDEERAMVRVDDISAWEKRVLKFFIFFENERVKVTKIM